MASIIEKYDAKSKKQRVKEAHFRQNGELDHRAKSELKDRKHRTLFVKNLLERGFKERDLSPFFRGGLAVSGSGTKKAKSGKRGGKGGRSGKKRGQESRSKVISIANKSKRR